MPFALLPISFLGRPARGTQACCDSVSALYGLWADLVDPRPGRLFFANCRVEASLRSDPRRIVRTSQTCFREGAYGSDLFGQDLEVALQGFGEPGRGWLPLAEQAGFDGGELLHDPCGPEE